jgi:hypothetical protein
MSLAVDWTKNLKTQEEKDKFASLVVNNRTLLGRLLEIVDEKLDALERMECNQETYQNPAYASWQAHVNGKRASLKDVRRLLEFLEA